MSQYRLRLICLYKYKIKIKVRSDQADKIKWNNGIDKTRRCKWILWTSDMLLKKHSDATCQYLFGMWSTTLNTLEWNGELMLVKTWKYTLDGPDICFFRSLKYSKYSLRIFVTATKFYGDGDGNPLVLTGPLQPWQTLTLLLQRLTTGIRTSL